MPNRIIKESIKLSPEIDALSWFEEIVFYRLIVTADDYGRLDGRVIVLRNELFPTKENITRKSVEEALNKLVSVGLLVPYADEVSNMPYYCLPTWQDHQRVRDSKAKYPPPPDGVQQLAATRRGLPQLAADCGLESESKIESESNNDDDDARANSVAAYASGCLQFISPGNLDELSGYMEILPDDLIRFAIDEACGNGAPRFAYVSRILQGYVRDGIRTVGDAKAAKDKRSASKAVKDTIPQAHNFTERANTDEDYASVLIDLTKGAE